MDCQEMRQRISMNLDGELNEQEEELLKEHLKACASCQEFQESLIELSGKMKQWEDEKAPTDLRENLFAVILEKEKKRTRLFGMSFSCYRVPVPLAWAAVLLFAFLTFHLAKHTFFEREVVTLEPGYEVATVRKEEAAPAKISITSEDIVSMTTNYKSTNSQQGGFK